ncbi:MULTISPECIES: methionine gamma-lyase [Clostridium]|uniref:L-methionine gamma-lyase n=1 Tax=Clostridium cadaveris TaxID=1529 RepID=A0A1I2PAK6_9CLOT|nr:methionine gamma-lyase [Clostridium cadaveris]MDU4953041.1 methionine gamma-lyase [Clostridium sp.]MDM8312753.1 methionine gamma-lyase [Clostridium cadaveris]MDY4949720.1 methionine gamma-lyase [Clostridium cadaveris]NME65761.1 methionine gamma-lyase [Clostridium cadaveris]PWL55605.1 MAG: methionine gamma-lyase [Clostridium cadaveris]
MNNKDLKNKGFATKAIHGGHQPNQYGALSTPIYQTSTFVFDNAKQGGDRFALKEDGYIYSRLGNPTNTSLEEKLALLEGTEAAISTASGIGAISAAMWTALKAGDHVVASDTLYGCTFAYLNHGLTRYGVEVTFCDASDPENIRKAMQENTRVVYLETPANPSLKINDIEAISKIAHENKNCLVFVDNTFCTPYIQRPTELGADVVIHSGTKYLNGHGDVISGFVCGTKEFIDNVRFFGIKDMTGANLSPFDAFLIIRGLKTLAIRMDRHCANAMKVAEFLESHPAVEKVYYPGLKSFPQYELAKKQMKLPGGMVAFELKGGLEEGIKVMDNVKLCKLAVSLGDAESLIEHPASMTHSPYSAEERAEAGISDSLVRLSVGLEDATDIIEDLNNVLNMLL